MRDNSYDQLARTFGFDFSINTCCISDLEQDQESHDSHFSRHKLKTMNIIEDDISDIEGSIDLKNCQSGSVEQKGESKQRSKSPVRKNKFMSLIKEKLQRRKVEGQFKVETSQRS